MPTQNTQDFAAQLYALLPLAITNGLRMLGAIVILLIGLWLAGKAHQIVLGMLGRTPHIDEMLKRFFGSAARYLVLTVTVLAVLSEFRVPTPNFPALLAAPPLPFLLTPPP